MGSQYQTNYLINWHYLFRNTGEVYVSILYIRCSMESPLNLYHPSKKHEKEQQALTHRTNTLLGGLTFLQQRYTRDR